MVKKKSGFTLIELLVVISIIALLLAILMPALGKVKAKAKEVVCRAHLRSFGQAAVTYAHDNDGKFADSHAQINPNTGSYAVYVTLTNGQGLWMGAGNFFKHGLIEEPKIYYCPGNNNKSLKYGKDHTDPADSGGGWPIGKIPEDLHPGQAWVQTTYHYRSLWDGTKWRAVNFTKDGSSFGFMADMFADPSRGVDFHHKDRYNVVYADGHCESVIDKEREIFDFNGGTRYHTDHAMQDKVWKRYFDMPSARNYPEK